MRFALGCNRPEPDDRDLLLASYLPGEPPKPPAEGDFGHGDLIADWGMLGNDRYGDCVLAGAAHETMLLGAEGGHHPAFTDNGVLQAYSEITGFNPSDPSTDQGTDPRSAAKYRRKTGIPDANGHRHHIGAYIFIKPGDLEQLWQALAIFGVVGACFDMPSTVDQQFWADQPWDVSDPNAAIEGGHYVPLIGRRNGNIDAVSWGKRIEITPAFYEKYGWGGVVYVSASALGPEGTTPEGLNKAALVADLDALVNYGQDEQGPEMSDGQDTSAEAGVEGTASEESVGTSSPEAPGVQGGISTSPATTPAPPTGDVERMSPVNAERRESDGIKPAMLDASRIGEALRPPEAGSSSSESED